MTTAKCNHRTSTHQFSYHCDLPAGHDHPNSHYYVSTPTTPTCARCGDTLRRHPATGHLVHTTPTTNPHTPTLDTTP